MRLDPTPTAAVPFGGLLVAQSAPFECDAGDLQVLEIDFGAAPNEIRLCVELALAGSTMVSSVAKRDLDGGTDIATALVHVAGHSAIYVLRLKIMGRTLDGGYHGTLPADVRLTVPIVKRATYAKLPPIDVPDTELAHWNFVERGIHRLAKRSRTANSLVAALEVRLGREEVLSLPQYMAVCPTGQCNATCAFCSVTINRTGIIKRQLPIEGMRRFTAPAARTVRMYGIEGNGEPMLYRGFSGLVHHVLSDGAIAYLITNASQIDAESLPLLLGFDSINISMNAATAATHRRVMGIKNFGEICENIRELARRRGRQGNQPNVSISLVVTRDNIFEAVAFLELAERLGVDRALLRPLSELGNESGAVEDLRDLVPYESDVADLIEAVGDYLEATKGARRVEVFFQPENFKATRPDPPVEAVLPIDQPNEVALPRQRYWTSSVDGAVVTWPTPGRVRVQAALGSLGSSLLRSTLIPVPPNRAMAAEMVLSGSATGLEIRARDNQGRLLAEAFPNLTSGSEGTRVRLVWGPAAVLGVSIEIFRGEGPIDIEIDLGRVRKPAQLVDPYPAVPPATRWELASPGAMLAWRGAIQDIRWSGPAGPYLVKSYSRRCLPGVTISYPVKIEVRSGRVGVGVLSQDFQSWVKTFDFGPGEHATDLEFATGKNSRLQIVVYSAAETPLDVSIDWSVAMLQRQLTASDLPRIMELAQQAADATPANVKVTVDPNEAKLERREAQRQARAALEDSKDDASVAATPAGNNAATADARQPRGGKFSRLFRDTRTIHCHKPWTDLANFTVDGRVDVCCIATGASQTRFALGNLNTQSFQDVWNGKQAREFRRTVNDPKAALPPCQRCPMAKAYSGPYLNPEATMFSVWTRFDRAPLNRTRTGRYALFAAFVACYVPIHFWLFRGFDKPSLKSSIDRIRGRNRA
ncbi:MAG: radical SAM/SPASM domain-containing protein [Hyphomicrobiaceae bacterium]